MTNPPPPAEKFNSERFLNAVTLRQIRYFVAAAEFGKVSSAAAMISISPSAVTDAINELEALAEVKLFERLPRGVALTYEGHRFLAHCRNVLAALRDASYAFSRPDSVTEGAFTLATSSTVIGYFIAPLLARFNRAFPNIETRLVEGDEAAITAGLLSGDYDLAFAVTSNIAPHPDIQRQVLVRSPRRLWLGPKHPLLKQTKVTMADIAEQPYIQLTIDGADRSTTRYWRDNNLEPRVVFRTESVEAVRSLISFGHGVTILADMMYRPWSLEGDRVEAREIAARIPTLDTGLMWAGEKLRSPAAAAFQTFCQIEASPRGAV
jgi:DNA-binding transcriptional LysR family regulator